MENLIRQYSNNLDFLREFISVVEPAIFKKHIEDMKADGNAAFPLFLMVSELLPELQYTKEEIEKNRPKFKYEIFKNGNSAHISIEDGYEEIFANAIKPFFQLSEQTNHLFKSTLISLISTVEWFYSQMLHKYFSLYPNSIEGKEKEISLNDLNSIGSIEEARIYLITAKVESILYQSLNDWIDYMKNHIKLSMGYLDRTRDFLYDAYLKRNLIIHNNGIVNTIYLRRAPVAFGDKAKKGEPILISKDYLLDAINKFECSFVLMACELWKKIGKHDNREDILLELCSNHLKAGRFSVSENLSYFGYQDSSLSEKARLDCLINYWLSIKNQNRYEEIKDEIIKVDFSAKDEVYQIAKCILLENYEQLIKILPSAIKAGKINASVIRTSPLFKEILKQKEFEDLLNQV